MKLTNTLNFISYFSFVIAFLLIPTTTHAQDFSLWDSPSSSAKDYKHLFNDNLRNAKKGDAKAMGMVGLLYEKGLGCDQNLKEAYKWLSKGARKGDATAENNLGYLYLKGLGIKKSETDALQWFQKAADQGLASAQSNLGLMYGRGIGTKKDFSQALSWFKKAAEQDDPDAQVNLAQMLSLGEGTSKDYVESHKWFSLALKNHSLDDAQVSDLRNDIEWLEKRMTGDQIKEARQRASDWKSSGQPTETPQD